MRCWYRVFSIAVLLFASQLALLAAPPANDAFDSASVIAGFPVSVTGTNLEATLEAGEPIPGISGSVAEASVWFSWTAPSSGGVQIDTFGSDFDTILGIWSGNSVSNLALIAEGDDAFGGSNSVVYLEASIGSTYRIAVYGYQGERGVVKLNITNDVTSRITGTVTATNGITPIQDIYAQVAQSIGPGWEAVAGAYTDANGYYEVRGLTGGTYRVEFFDWDTGDYLYEVYSNAVDLASGADIVVGTSTIVSNINARLDAASSISGTVTGPDGTTPLEGIYAQAYGWNGTGWSSLGGAYTGTNGYYEIAGLTGGTYRVQFEDLTNGFYVAEVYSNAVDLDSGTDIIVGVAATESNIDESLALAPQPASIVNLAMIGPGDWEVSYTGTIGVTYILQETTSLIGTFTNVGASFLCTPGTNTVSRSSTESKAFWRIRSFP